MHLRMLDCSLFWMCEKFYLLGEWVAVVVLLARLVAKGIMKCFFCLQYIKRTEYRSIISVSRIVMSSKKHPQPSIGRYQFLGSKYPAHLTG